MKNQPINHGYIQPVIKPEDYRFGSGQIKTAQLLQLDGDWIGFLPVEENQDLNGIETYNCTAFAITDQTEIYMKRKFGIAANYSARFLGLMAGSKPPGNDPNVVYEAARKNGFIPEEMCPFSEDIKSAADYFSWKGVDKEACIAEGKRWLSEYEFFHDWVADGKETTIDIMKVALQYSPLCAAVYAWAIDGKGIYVRMGKDTHWSTFFRIDDYVNDFDSYDPHLKKLILNFCFKYVKRISIEKQATQQEINIFQRILSAFVQILRLDLIWSSLKKNPESEMENKSEAMDEPIKDETAEIAPETPQISPYEWSDREKARHSCRVVMDEFNLSKIQKDILCAIIEAESGFDPKATHKNFNKNGILASTDWGICQINDFYWIGKGKYFASIGEVLNFPEKSVRFMCERFRAGQLSLWTAYKNGNYKRYL